jgi:hypothetical protein
MAIGSVIEHGSYLYVYDEHGRSLFSKARGNGAKDGLLGYTSGTVTMRYGSLVYTYGLRGEVLHAKAA